MICEEDTPLPMLEETIEEVPSGPSEEVPSETESAKALKPEWIDIGQYDDSELEVYLQSHDFKLICTHGKRKSNCSIHPDLHIHRQEYSYLRCASIKCRQTDSDSCQFVIKVS